LGHAITRTTYCDRVWRRRAGKVDVTVPNESVRVERPIKGIEYDVLQPLDMRASGEEGDYSVL
jgi:hypothetical protein